MQPKVFLDTNVFIYSFEFPDSNSKKIITLLNNNKIRAIISIRVFNEVIKYFEKYHNTKVAKYYRRYLTSSCIIITADYVREEIEKWCDKIKNKDVEQIAVVKKLKILYLISYDKDFVNFQEYLTPKRFIGLIGMKASDSEF